MSAPFEAGIDLNRYLLAPECIATTLRISEKEASALIRREMRHARIGTRLIRVHRQDFRAWRQRLTHERTGSECDRVCAPNVPQAAQTPGTVYFIEAVGADRIKIGWTGASDARERMRSLQTASPFELGILLETAGTMLDEQAMHRRFRHLRVSPTTEWFHARDELWAFMTGIVDRRACDGTYPANGCVQRTVLVTA